MDFEFDDTLAKALQAFISKQIDIVVDKKMQELAERMEEERDTMTAKEVMDRLKIGRWCLWSMGERGELKPCAIIGRRKIYRRYDVEELLRKKSLKQYLPKHSKQ